MGFADGTGPGGDDETGAGGERIGGAGGACTEVGGAGTACREEVLEPCCGMTELGRIEDVEGMPGGALLLGDCCDIACDEGGNGGSGDKPLGITGGLAACDV